MTKMPSDMTEKPVELVFVDKKNDEVISFFRTFLGVYIRLPDMKRFSTKKLFQNYRELVVVEKQKRVPDPEVRFCVKCRQNRPKIEFFRDNFSVCKSCAMIEKHVSRMR